MGVIRILPDDKRSIWHTYLCRARRLTRCAVYTVRDSQSYIEVRPPETDDALECCQNCGPDTFYESINSIVFSVFTAEFRINLAAREVGVYEKELTQYTDNNGKLITLDPEKTREFQSLRHYEKWLNLPSVSSRAPTPEYWGSIKKLKDWIGRRNDIAHAKYWKFGQSDITPRHALECYQSVVGSIFELNIILGHGDRESNEKSKREVGLIP